MTSLYKAEKQNIAIAREFIEAGKIVCLPTETVYALSCIASNPKSIEKIFDIKKRDKNKAFAVFCPDISTIEKIAYLNNKAIELIEEFTPGPLTLILKSKKNLLPIINNNLETIAIRIPNDRFTLQLLKEINAPIIATSINLSTQPAATKIDDIDNDIYNQIDLIIDGGVSKIGIASTIVDLSDDDIKLVREGVISLSELI